jgi:isocitrate lyase
MTRYNEDISHLNALIDRAGKPWASINPEFAARMRQQNRFKTGLQIAQYTADIMRKDMDEYDQDSGKYTQSLGCWHGFIAQQKIISIKKHHGSTDKRYLYLSGWMIAALRSEFGPLPDQSMHEKTSVPALIEEIYTFLRQADARDLGHLFTRLDEASSGSDSVAAQRIQNEISNYQTHVVPIIADIDAGFGNEEATYLLAKRMIEAGACAIQLENQVSDVKQCGHQDGKVTVPHEEFLAKIRAVRYAFLELGIENGIIVARTDSLGAGLTQKIAVTKQAGDLGDLYNQFLELEPLLDASTMENGDIAVKVNGRLQKTKTAANGLFRFREGTGVDRVVLDCITSLQQGADLLWIETSTPDVAEIGAMVKRIKAEVPNAKLVYNNSPSFNWTLNFRQQVFDRWESSSRDLTAYNRAQLMNAIYDESELALEADKDIQNFQSDAAREAGVFHHLITLPTYHTAALSTDTLAKGYFGEEGMLAYVSGVQRQEIRNQLACVKHQDMAGSNIGDDHKSYFSGEAALKAGGQHNTMNQFS